MTIMELYFDGATEPKNPGGVSTGGFIVKIEGKTMIESHRMFKSGGPTSTNNFAEWSALGIGLRWILENWPEPIDALSIYGDSQLVIYQLTGKWACNKEHLQKLRGRCQEILATINPKHWSANWIPREQNEEADALSQKAYVEFTGKPFPERKRK